ncbi:hypothetical protein CMO83_03960 [Candidatus Woesearchaeota archaeon]|jgi:hypothetical protein|nr:hypothetical protein [Candidatus Woesearchaeota archaeon]MAG91805.1 hypothetical protein [Candidatus Woesearchaeota archaeon]|tara:strand:+ start:7134 stop:7919 length:786 start_codon:yes stop_codon:yes gene_type:complete
MKLINTVKNSYFVKSFRLAKSNLNKTGLIVLFDVMFIISFFVSQRFFKLFAGGLYLPQTFSTIFIFIGFSLIYYLIVLFIYSFFKYSILDFVKSLFGKTEFSLKKLGQFYLLNIIITGIFFAIMLVLNSILINVKESYAPFVFIFLAVPFLLFLYIVVNIAHSLFYEGNSIKDTIKKSFGFAFTKVRTYRETILAMILLALLLWLLFLGSGYLIRLFTSKNYTLYLATYQYFKRSSIIILDVVFYLVILINRISFYSMMRK